MKHIIGKTPEKTEESMKTAVMEAVDEREGGKTDRNGEETIQEVPQETETAAEGEKEPAPRTSGTALRIGAFMTAALCLLAGVRAVQNPGSIQGESLNGVSSLTVKAADTATGTERNTENTESSAMIQTTAVSDGSTTVPRETALTSQITNQDTTASAQTVMTTVGATEPYSPVSKTRTQEELAEAFAHIPLSNEAKLAYDVETLSTLVPAFTLTEQDEPLVLIMHTHGSEGYADTDGHSKDTDKNVVAVGEALEEILQEMGIPVLHDERMYDVPSYTKSYNEAYQGIQDTLEQNPSIQIVMDIHRDAYTYDDGSLLRTADTLTGADGETLRTSRVMFLVGTNAGTLEHPTWRSHLAFAMALQTRMEDIVPGITRSVFLRRQRFNEHMTPGSLLVEIGSSGDTLEEAKAAVRVFGKALAEQILAGEA